MADLVEVRTVALQVQPGRSHLDLLLRYDPTEPLAVTLVFTEPDGDVVPWEFGRDLLAAGLQRWSGSPAGDVQVARARPLPFVWLYLTGQGGTAVVRLPRGPVVRFLEATYRVVPAGCERVDVDAAVAQLLGQATP